MEKLSSGKDDRGKCPGKNVWWKNSHQPVPTALIAFILQHLLVAFGVWRSSNTRFRQIQVALHSHLGYCCWLFGAISTILAGFFKECNDVLVVSWLLFLTPFIFSAVGVFLDCLTDKRVGIIPPRKQWPVLEAVKLEGKGPFTLHKWIVFGIFAGLMILIWLLMIGSSSALIASADKLFSTKKSKLSSLFGQCSISNEVSNKRNKTLVFDKDK